MKSDGPLYLGHQTLHDRNTYLCSAEGWDIYSGVDGDYRWIYLIGKNDASSIHPGVGEASNFSVLPPSVQALARAHYHLIQ